MARVSQKFVDQYLYGKMMDAVRALNEVLLALDPSEQDSISKIKDVIQQITSIEI